jgi:hypothetical protein
MFWTSIAAELRIMILEALIRIENIAHCASAGREWQVAIEKHNFHSLNLTAQDVPLFEIMAARNLSLVKYIRYSITLQNYDCTQCDVDETKAFSKTNGAIVADGIQTMYRALSKRPCDGDMTLDISIHSLSDTKHHFKYIRFDPANALGSRNFPEPASHHDALHSSPTSLLPVAAIGRLFPDIGLVEDDPRD